MFYTLQSIIKIVNKKCFYLQAKSSWQKRYFSSLHRKKSGAFFPRMPCSPWRRSAAKIPAFTYKHIRLSSKQSPWRPAGRRRPPSRTACRSTQRQQKKRITNGGEKSPGGRKGNKTRDWGFRGKESRCWIRKSMLFIKQWILNKNTWNICIYKWSKTSLETSTDAFPCFSGCKYDVTQKHLVSWLSLGQIYIHLWTKIKMFKVNW